MIFRIYKSGVRYRSLIIYALVRCAPHAHTLRNSLLMTSNRKADLMSLNAIASLHAPRHCYDSASLRFAEIVAMAVRLGKAVSAIAPSLSMRSSASLPTRNRPPSPYMTRGRAVAPKGAAYFIPRPPSRLGASALRLNGNALTRCHCAAQQPPSSRSRLPPKGAP